MGNEKGENLRLQAEIGESNSPFKKKQAVDLSFRHITYYAQSFKWKSPFTEQKQILFGVNGDFAAGSFTAIMGPSGAGKTTLLNVLAGYKTKGSYGQVLINGRDRTLGGMKNFLQMSGYILQDSTLRDTLTVQESMMVAAELKLGRKATSKEKHTHVEQLLKMLGLNKQVNTLSCNLSGGQKRRLSIAYELITNPPILFLDEPTTGLDSSACFQCISILKMLANEGRTIITTIHQPSALVFELFDNVYALAEGQCIYNGPTTEIVPYMADKGLPCPVYHNPADFLIEVAVGEHGPVVDSLKLEPSEPVDNEKLRSGFRFPKFSLEELKEGIKRRKIFKSDKSEITHQNSFFTEFYYLYMRNLIMLQRNYKRRISIFLAHFLMALLLALIYYDSGNNASKARSNMAFVFAILIYMVYVGLMTVSLALPIDLKAMNVEYFNQWYSLTPYYLSLLCIEVPLQAINITVSMPMVYVLTDQPMEVFRCLFFLAFVVITTLTAQSFGFMLGAMLPIKVGVFIGPVSSCVLCIFGFSLQIKDTPYFFQLCALVSYVRSAFHSIAYLLYGFGRAPLECTSEIYCHFKEPGKILSVLDIGTIDVYSNFLYIVSVGIFIHCVTFGFLHRQVSKH